MMVGIGRSWQDTGGRPMVTTLGMEGGDDYDDDIQLQHTCKAVQDCESRV